MSATVTNIIAQIKVLTAASLGATWHELPNTSDLASNDLRRAAKGYGTRPLGASNAPTVTSAYSLDHTFEVVLMNTNPRKDNESQAMTAITDLYDKQDDIFKSLVRTKINLGGTVIMVFQPTLSEPEFVSKKEFVALRQQFIVRYRQNI